MIVEDSGKKTVYVVTIDTRRFFDECQYSYLPVMHRVFGVYDSLEKAHKDVWDYFVNNETEQYEICFDDYDADGVFLGYDDTFKRTDERYGGCAYYGVDYHTEVII